MDNISAPIARSIVTSAEATMEKLAKSLGLVLSGTNGSYTSRSVTFKFELSIPSVSGAPVGRSAEMFKAFTRGSSTIAAGLKPEDLGRQFKFSNKVCEIVGWNTKAKKYPVEIRYPNGQIARWAPATVKAYLDKCGVEVSPEEDEDKPDETELALARLGKMLGVEII